MKYQRPGRERGLASSLSVREELKKRYDTTHREESGRPKQLALERMIWHRELI